jgi:hypothetical protein
VTCTGPAGTDAGSAGAAYAYSWPDKPIVVSVAAAPEEDSVADELDAWLGLPVVAMPLSLAHAPNSTSAHATATIRNLCINDLQAL